MPIRRPVDVLAQLDVVGDDVSGTLEAHAEGEIGVVQLSYLALGGRVVRRRGVIKRDGIRGLPPIHSQGGRFRDGFGYTFVLTVIICA